MSKQEQKKENPTPATASEQDFIDCRESAQFIVKELFEYGWLKAESRDQATEWLRDWLSHYNPATASELCDHYWQDYGTLKYGDNPTLQIEACIRCGIQRRKPKSVGSALDMLCQAEDCTELATGFCAKHTPKK